MTLHRNSQPRIYVENGVYFITTNTYQAYQYFEEDLLCEMLIEELWHYSRLKQFDIFAYKINPEHIHIIIRPNGDYNYSQALHAFKKNFGYDINCVMGFNDVASKAGKQIPTFCNTLRQKYHKKFIQKHGNEQNIPKFKWQDSFRDHLIRDERDLHNHIEYIRNQWIKHNLPENKYCYIDENIVL